METTRMEYGKMIIPYADRKIQKYDDRIVLSETPFFPEDTDVVFLCRENSPSVITVCKEQISKDGRTILGIFKVVDYASYYIDTNDARAVESNPLRFVDHPSHYQSSNGLEVIDVIDAFTEKLTGVVAFDIGCAIKYMCRWKKKGGTEDLRKAIWYLQHAIKKTEEEENGSVHSGEDK